MNSHGNAADIPCRSDVLESIYVSAGQRLSAGGMRQLEEFWWAHQDSNLEPADYESDALTD
jgi:hypothetical protein